MRLPIAKRGELERVEDERAEWQRRSEHLLGLLEQVPPPSQPPRRSLWASVVAAGWLLMIGTFIGGAIVPHTDDRPRLCSDVLDGAVEQVHDELCVVG